MFQGQVGFEPDEKIKGQNACTEDGDNLDPTYSSASGTLYWMALSSYTRLQFGHRPSSLWVLILL